MKTNLASALKRVGRASEAVLGTIQIMQIRTVEELDTAWGEAYELNHWSRTKGRPRAGVKLKPAPQAVQYYVSLITSVYKYGSNVLELKTMYDVRQAVKELKSLNRHEGEDEPAPELKGLTISSEKKLTGSFWHDTLVTWKLLPEDRQHEVVEKMNEIMRQLVEELHIELEPQ